MSRATITLSDRLDRSRAINWIEKAPPGTRVEFKAAQRSNAQNDRMWAMLTDVATQVRWHGIPLKADDWKMIFLDALKRELRTVPNIDGTGIVVLGKSSSDLSKAEMSDLIELIHAFGAEHGVTFHDTDSNSSQPLPPVDAETDKPASEPNPSALGAGTNSESSGGSLTDDGVQAGTEQDKPGAGLPTGWQSIYVKAMNAASDRPKSLQSRHTEALKMIGGEPSEADLEEMRAIYALRQRNLKGEISAEEYQAGIREIVGDVE